MRICFAKTELPVDPEAVTLMTDVNTALMKEFFTVTSESGNLTYDRQLDHFTRNFELAERVQGIERP